MVYAMYTFVNHYVGSQQFGWLEAIAQSPLAQLRELTQHCTYAGDKTCWIYCAYNRSLYLENNRMF